MSYPGNQELSEQAQDRVIAAFRQVIAKLQGGERDEARIGLEFVLRLDPAFAPAANLHEQLATSSGPVDVGAIIGGLQAPSTDAINLLLVEAVEDFNNRDYLDAHDKVKKVLLDLPGHKEARELLGQVEEALRVETQVGQFLTQAREALDRADPQEAANFVMMAQALDPHFSGIDTLLREIQDFNEGGGQPPATAPETRPPAEPVQTSPADEVQPAFDTMAFSTDGFDISFEENQTPEPAAQEQAQDFFVPEAILDDSPPPRETNFVPLEASSFEFGAADQPAVADDPPPPDDEFSFGGDEVAPVVPPEVDGGLFSTDTDVADLFDAAAVDDELFGTAGPAAAAGAPAAGSVDIEAALNVGARAFEEGEFQRAIDAWSTILAVDPNHGEALRRVEMAAERLRETEQKFQAMLADARAAEGSDDPAEALSLVNAALLVQPGDPEASELKMRLQAAAAGSALPPVPPTMGTDTADDLFSSDLPDDLPLAADFADGDEVDLQIPTREPPPDRSPARRLPWRFIGAGAAAVLVILVGVWLGSRFLASSETANDTAALNRVLQQAEGLYEQRRIDEAIHLLRQFDAAELDRERIARRIEKYQQAQAPPEPTPIPGALIEGEQLFEERQWIAAFAKAALALETNPQNEGLADLKQRIMDSEPRVATLFNAMQKGDHRTAASIAEELAQRHPDHPEFADQLEKSLFNAGLSELRAFNLAAAEIHFARLATLDPEDAEVRRVLKFIGRYKARPVDMQLEIFIQNLKSR